MLVDFLEHIAAELGLERIHRGLSVEVVRIILSLPVMMFARVSLCEDLVSDISCHVVLQLGDLAEQTRDDIFGDLILLLLLVEPGEIFVLLLQVIQLLVVAVQRSGVALLVDQTLAFLQGLSQLLLLLEEKFDPVNLLGLSLLGSFLLALLLLFLFALGLLNLGLTLLHLSLKHIELAFTFFFHDSTKGVETLFVFVTELGNQLAGIHLVRCISFSLLVNAITSCLFFKKLTFKIT